MSTTVTTNMQLVKPDQGTREPASIFTHVNPNTDKIDAHDHSTGKGAAVRRLTSGLFSARPALGNAGHVYLATDTAQFFYDTGAAWKEAMVSPITAEGDLIIGSATAAPARLAKGTSGHVLQAGASTLAWAGPVDLAAWTAFTPELRQNGVVVPSTINAARYAIVGKTAFGQVRLTCNAAGTVGTDITISGIPAAIAPRLTNTFTAACGSGEILDSGTSFYVGIAIAMSATAIGLQAHSTTGKIGSQPSFALANGDEIALDLMYEIQ
jgi:hypothetical protein